MLILLGALLMSAIPRSALAVTQLKRGAEAPAFTLKDHDGNEVSGETLKGKIIVLIFGEAYHQGTRQVCTQIDAVLQDTRFDASQIATVLITSRQAKGDEDEDGKAKLPKTILRDAGEKVYDAYEVAVIPSIVVIDKEGKVVHAVAGATARASDIITDSLLYAAGKLSAQRLDESLLPTTGPTAGTTEDLRADRLALLAKQLTRRGMAEMAAEKYAEALKLDPHHEAAHLGLGQLLLRGKHLADAETHFRAVLVARPGLPEASLGLAAVQTQRGGKELDEAEQTVRGLLARNPSQPIAHYLLGLIQEQKGKTEDAASSFKKAAQLLLESRSLDAE
jgi:peroxiredoxin/TolA-binding protein